MQSQPQNLLNRANIDPFQIKHKPDITSGPISHPNTLFFSSFIIIGPD